MNPSPLSSVLFGRWMDGWVEGRREWKGGGRGGGGIESSQRASFVLRRLTSERDTRYRAAARRRKCSFPSGHADLSPVLLLLLLLWAGQAYLRWTTTGSRADWPLALPCHGVFIHAHDNLKKSFILLICLFNYFILNVQIWQGFLTAIKQLLNIKQYRKNIEGSKPVTYWPRCEKKHSLSVLF